MFRTYFGYPREEAERLMLLVHDEGRAVVATGPREEMERHTEAMHEYGLRAQHDAVRRMILFTDAERRLVIELRPQEAELLVLLALSSSEFVDDRAERDDPLAATALPDGLPG